MRKISLILIRWLHAVLILSLIAPLAFAIGGLSDMANAAGVYPLSLLIAIPVVVSDVAAKRCRGLGGYLLINILVQVLTVMTGWFFAPYLSNENMLYLYVGILAAESILIVVDRFRYRLETKERQDEQNLDPTKQVHELIWNEPTFAKMVFFAVIYLLGLGFTSPWLCNIVFFSAILYFFAVLWYQFVSGTEKYLHLNRRTANLPTKRLYGIRGGVFALLLLSMLLATLLSVAFMSQRRYTDITKWFQDIEYEEESWEIPQKDIMPGQVENNAMQELLDSAPEGKMPEWVKLLFKLAAVLILCVVVFMIIYSIRNIFQNFRKAKDENGDIIEELLPDKEKPETIAIKKPTQDNENMDIRKRYRKWIRKCRKEIPGAYETPHELEENAGLSQNPEMQELHILYEKVRYGK